jgi:hypothetical protein
MVHRCNALRQETNRNLGTLTSEDLYPGVALLKGLVLLFYLPNYQITHLPNSQVRATPYPSKR